MGRERAIIHFNVADFAVAVERVADCALRKKPVIIAPFQAARALVYDMSEEAFQCGVHKGMALRQATRLCRGASVLLPRPDVYRRAMQAFLGQVREYSPLLEHGIIDGHLFVDVTGTHRLFGPAPDIGWRVRRRARNDLGINPIWTLAANKLVAKVASRLVKPVGEYIVAAGEEEDFLAPLPLHLLPGLSPEEIRRLREFNLASIGQLAALNRQQLLVPFGDRSGFLYEASHGKTPTTADRCKAPLPTWPPGPAMNCAAEGRWPGGSGSGSPMRTGAIRSGRLPTGGGHPRISPSGTWHSFSCKGPGPAGPGSGAATWSATACTGSRPSFCSFPSPSPPRPGRRRPPVPWTASGTVSGIR